MDLPHAQKTIKAAWILGVVKGIGTLCLVIYSTCIETVYGVGFEGLLDVAIPLGLSFGIYRRSRACAVLMVCYDLFSIGAVQVDQAKGVAVNSGFLLVLLYFFFQGARGSFAYHRLTRQEAVTLPDSSPPVIVVASPPYTIHLHPSRVKDSSAPAIEAVSPTTPNVTAPRSETTPVHAYFILQNDELEGPYGIEELRSLWNSGVVTGETFYCEEGYEQWFRLDDIADLLESASSRPPVINDPVSAGPPPHVKPEEQQIQPQVRVGYFKWLGQTFFGWLLPPCAERTSAGQDSANLAPPVSSQVLSPGRKTPQAVRWDIGWSALAVGTLAICSIYWFVVDPAFVESLMSSPTPGTGRIIGGVLLLSVGAAVGVPLWFFARPFDNVAHGRARISFKLFALVGMATLLAVGWAGQAERTRSEQYRLEWERTEKQKLKQQFLSGVLLLDTTLTFSPPNADEASWQGQKRQPCGVIPFETQGALLPPRSHAR
jgi:serine/threonine-protein kinase